MYGTGTRSYNRSTEKREMDRQRAEYNRKIAAGEVQFAEVEILMCHCRSFRSSHDPSEHRRLRAAWDWRVR